MVRSHVAVLCMLAVLLVAVAVLRSVVLTGGRIGGEVEGEEDDSRNAGGLVADGYNAESAGRWVYATTAGPP